MNQHLFKVFVSVSLLVLVVLLLVPSSKTQGVQKILTLDPVGPDDFGQTGSVLIQVDNGHTLLKVYVTRLKAHAAHTLWLILDTAAAPFVAGSCATGCMASDPNGNTAPVFPFTPGNADNAGFRAGIGLDPNAFVTDANGNATWQTELNYDLFQSAVAPLVLRPGTRQSAPVDDSSGTCVASASAPFKSVVDSGYMRVFSAPGPAPSFQVSNGLLSPALVRGTVVRFTFAQHFDGLTHGHLPGVNFPASPCGDWAARLSAPLSAAVPAN